MGTLLKVSFVSWVMFNAIWAKMMGLQLGITFARSLSLFVEFELDSAIVMDMVNKGFTSTTLLRSHNWRVHITITHREENGCADLLASHGHSTSFSLTVIDSSFPLLDAIMLNTLITVLWMLQLYIVMQYLFGAMFWSKTLSYEG